MIVGLGNPGLEYADTRHNAGFMTVDRLVEKARRTESEEHRYASFFRVWRYAGRDLLLVKPQTFMNRSGLAVAKFQRVFELRPDEILVVYDCLDLPLGRLRLRHSGSSGGHRGMESIIQALGDSAIPRLRVGIGRARAGGSVEHVLSGYAEDELPALDRVLDLAVAAVLCAIRRGIVAAMNQYNGKLIEAEAGNESPSASGEENEQSDNG